MNDDDMISRQDAKTIIRAFVANAKTDGEMVQRMVEARSRFPDLFAEIVAESNFNSETLKLIRLIMKSFDSSN